MDLFESFFPFQVTERGCALCFNFNISLDPERAGSAPPAGVVISCSFVRMFRGQINISDKALKKKQSNERKFNLRSRDIFPSNSQYHLRIDQHILLLMILLSVFFLPVNQAYIVVLIFIIHWQVQIQLVNLAMLSHSHLSCISSPSLYIFADSHYKALFMPFSAGIPYSHSPTRILFWEGGGKIN